LIDARRRDQGCLRGRRDSGAFEAKSLPQQAGPTAKRTFPTDPRKKHCGGFVKERAQLAITASRDVAIMVNFSRLEGGNFSRRQVAKGFAAI
jgi:hypothetical protein